MKTSVLASVCALAACVAGRPMARRAASQQCTSPVVQSAVDGGFEDSPSAWTAQNGGFIGANDPAQAHSGSGYGGLDAPSKNSTPSLSETYSTPLPGDTAYDLEYWYAYSSPHSGFAECTLTVRGDNTVIDTIQPNNTVTGYEQRIIAVVNTTFSTLSFTLSGCLYSVNRVFIDDVSLLSTDDDACAFQLQLVAASANTTFEGQYLRIGPSDRNIAIATAIPDLADASTFFFDPAGNIATLHQLDYAMLIVASAYGSGPAYDSVGQPMRWGDVNYSGGSSGGYNGGYVYGYQVCSITTSSDANGDLFLDCEQPTVDYQPYYCASQELGQYLQFGIEQGDSDEQYCFPYDLKVLYVNQ